MVGGHMEVLPPLPLVRTHVAWIGPPQLLPISNLRCSSSGSDLGVNDVAQLVFDAVVLAVRLVLVEQNLSNNA